LLQHALAARAKNPDIYATQVAEKIIDEGLSRVVISDWRYKREYDYLAREFQNNGGISDLRDYLKAALRSA
jgi:hypothetical protein